MLISFVTFITLTIGVGLIAVDKHYNIIAPFNTRGMYRGVANSEGEFQVRIYQDR